MNNNNKEQAIMDKLIKEKEVRKLISWSATTIWRRRKEGNFPQPIKKAGTNFWKLSDINNWMNEHIEATLKEQKKQEQLKNK